MKFQVRKEKDGQDLSLCEFSLGVLGKTLEFSVSREDYERLRAELYDSRLVKSILRRLPRKHSAKAAREQSTDKSHRSGTVKKDQNPAKERRSRSNREWSAEDGP